MAELVWTEPALSDLNEIAEYIALENPVAAQKLVQEIFSAVERLERHPGSGKIPEELGTGRYREVVVNPCRIFYRHPKGKVFILYVMRSERGLRNFLLEDRDERGN
ncbi:type II toxin-antitoxin system RelE/ParE family toxin [Seongchinamella sediminis]|uniref:Type II toxin-antitoxin system RelE/ParE family toxin n=1 Tax=Seongchinamella sediminis TaxID=2283635 RepID=A0A3L7DX76_9GAMM|nr:type II toxin-antitoxin system RelE/ParE family toxin [Seongchinamella sediminis]RLQ20853.1 type II toxin-antitoxin system RelE/ParE family toxin [Seongchinamella sediminis]